jgi:hypothetical protein
LIGGGGITAIVLARLGTRKPHALNPPETIGIQALLGDRFAIDSLSREMKELNDNLGDVSRSINRYCDLMEITRSLDHMHRDDK